MAGRAAGHPSVEGAAINPNPEVNTTNDSQFTFVEHFTDFGVSSFAIPHLIVMCPGGRGRGGCCQ